MVLERFLFQQGIHALLIFEILLVRISNVLRLCVVGLLDDRVLAVTRELLLALFRLLVDHIRVDGKASRLSQRISTYNFFGPFLPEPASFD